MDSIEISVIIPTHNNGDTIERAVMSIVNQDFKLPYEVVVVQDACSDNTSEILEKLCKKYGFINTIAVNNRCVINTRIDGLKLAKGKYIMWLDGDDYYHGKMLSRMYQAITENDADLVNCGVYYVKKSGIKKDALRTNGKYGKYKAYKTFLNDFTFRGFLHTKIYKKELLDIVGITKFPKYHYIYEDVLTNAIYLTMANKVVAIKDPLIYYNKTNENSITTKSKTRVFDIVNIHAYIRYYLEKLGDQKLLKLFRHSYIRCRLSLIADIAMNQFDSKEDKKRICKQAKKDLLRIYSKKPFELEGHSWSKFIKDFEE